MVTADAVCVLHAQLQLAMRTMKSDGSKRRMNVDNDSTMMDGGR